MTQEKIRAVDAWRKLFDEGFRYSAETIRIWIQSRYQRSWVWASEFDWLRTKAMASSRSNGNLGQNGHQKAVVIGLIRLLPEPIVGRQLIELAVLHGAASRSTLQRRNVTANRELSRDEAIAAISGKTLTAVAINKNGRRVRRRNIYSEPVSA